MPSRGRRRGHRGATFSMSQGYHHPPNCHTAAHHSTPPKQRRPLRRPTAAPPARDMKTIASEAGAKQDREAGRPPRRRGEPAVVTDTGEAAAVRRPAHRSPSGGATTYMGRSDQGHCKRPRADYVVGRPHQYASSPPRDVHAGAFRKQRASKKVLPLRLMGMLEQWRL